VIEKIASLSGVRLVIGNLGVQKDKLAYNAHFYGFIALTKYRWEALGKHRCLPLAAAA
jgi:hypothetical protein